VQPEIGKYLIAVGEWLFGLHPFGWRVASAFFGTLAVLVMCRGAPRMARSTLRGRRAGLPVSLDGLELARTRTGRRCSRSGASSTRRSGRGGCNG